MNRAVFIDRDGVINHIPEFTGDPTDPANYVLSWDQFHWAYGAIDGLRLLSTTDYLWVIVSNQACVGYHLAYSDEIDFLFCKMRAQLMAVHDVKIAGMSYLFCPHKVEERCECRKPEPGMLYRAAGEHNIRLSDSWMIGDSDSDIEAGTRAGVKGTIMIRRDAKSTDLVRWFYEESPMYGAARNLLEAVKLILAHGD